MSDQQPDRPARREHPVLVGLAALVAVAVVVGAILGGGALAATRVLGIGGDAEASGQETARETLYLPEPSEDGESEGSDLGLPPDTSAPSTTIAPPSTTAPVAGQITLTAGQTAVSSMQQIDLTGTYVGGDGAILRVQRLEGDTWGDFPVTASVSGGAFTTYIRTGQTGLNTFRMLDTDTGETSNEIEVQIG